MVSVGKLSAGQARYYLDQAATPVSAAQALTSGIEDYYLGGPQAAGRWLGRGALALRLEGRVGDAEFEAILGGIAPATGEPLRRHGSVAGFDVTFSAPKSVSILFGLGSAEIRGAVRAAHEHAVLAAFGYFERSTAFARRGAGGSSVVPGDGLIAASFLHRISRAGDPQLHTHVVVANAVRAADGRWSALDGRLIYAHARTAGFLYQAQLREELTRTLGVEWTAVTKGSAEVRGVPSRAIRAFSRRRAEIEASMQLHGSRGRHAAQVAALDTRRTKDRTRSPEELASEWRLRAARLNLRQDRIDALRDRATPELPNWTSVFVALAASSGLTEQRSSFTRRDVLQAVSEVAGSGARVSELEAVADAFLRSPGVVPLVGRATEPRYSTVELLETERAAVEMSLALRAAGRGLATESETLAALARHQHLSGEQRVMVERLTRGGEGVAVVIGVAGTGKTTALAAAREAWEASGLQVRGCAIARKAAHELRERGGIDATSVHALLRGRLPLAPGAVLVIDEASMLGTRQFAHVLERVNAAHGKLVVVGDTRQLPAIEAGGILGALAARLPVVELKDNRRQQEAWERQALALLRDGDTDEALGLYERHGRVRVGERGDEILDGLLRDWHATNDPHGCLMIAHYRTDVGEINGRARAVMRAAGRLGRDELVIGGGRFATGDHVIIKQNSSRLDVRNGERGVVERIDLRAGAVTVRFADRVAQLDATFLTRKTYGGRPTLEHGYAITAHAAQGVTCRHALVLARDDTYREWAYTTMSRATVANRLYVIADRNRGRDEFAPAEPAQDGRALLAAALTRRRAEELALDLLGGDQERARGIDR
jgi:conjugative relaxase-like TrwC/TraI family protein